MKRQALLVGSFVIGALVLVVAAIFWLSGNSLFQKQLRALLHFESGVAGLYVGAPVTFRGVPVGQVEAIGIEVDPQSLRARIPVRVRLQPGAVRSTAARADGGDTSLDELATLVQRGLRAKLVAQSFVTGQKSIELDFVADAMPPEALAAGAAEVEIPVVADRFDALVDQLAELPLRDTVEDLRATLQALQQTLEATRGTLDVAGRELAATAVEARETLGVATDALRQVQGGATQAMDAVRQLTQATTDTVVAARPEIDATLGSARQAAETARLAMARLADITAPGAPLRSDLDAAVRDLSQAARGLRDWSELLEQQPNAVIFGRERP